MQWIVNRLRGELRVVARGPFPERLMNVCAQNGISFWALEWRDGHTLSMTVRQEDRKQLWKLAERVGCTVETAPSRWTAGWWKNNEIIRKRKEEAQ